MEGSASTGASRLTTRVCVCDADKSVEQVWYEDRDVRRDCSQGSHCAAEKVRDDGLVVGEAALILLGCFFHRGVARGRTYLRGTNLVHELLKVRSGVSLWGGRGRNNDPNTHATQASNRGKKFDAEEEATEKAE